MGMVREKYNDSRPSWHYDNVPEIIFLILEDSDSFNSIKIYKQHENTFISQRPYMTVLNYVQKSLQTT
jgi:hypothetical protein